MKSGLVGAVSTILPGDYIKGNTEELYPVTTPTGTDDTDWQKVRSQFILERGVTYMNNASLGMPPAVVINEVKKGYEAISSEPLHGKHDLQEEIAKKVMPGLANMFGTQTDEIVLTRNASEALHMQATGLILKPGDEVIITTQEHPAGLGPWMYRQKRDGIKVKQIFIPSPLTSESDVVKRFSKAITPKTKALSFCHVTRGGHLYPVKQLAAMARKRGLLTLVDGAQAVGQFPIDINQLGCDAYAVSLHKWILAPAGTGFLYIRKDARDRIKSAFAADTTLESPRIEPPGTKDSPVRAAILPALNFANKLGQENIEKRCRFLSDYLKDGLEKIQGVTLLSGASPVSYTHLTLPTKA